LPINLPQNLKQNQLSINLPQNLLSLLPLLPQT
jgi:hypothetical protein